jgi:hypothetical protein
VNVPANNATFSGALSQDPDVAAGLQSIRNGTAARLAASAGQRTP